MKKGEESSDFISAYLKEVDKSGESYKTGE